MGDRAVVLSLGKPERAAEQIEALAARAPVDAIVAADDGGTRAAAQAAARLGLRGNPPEAVARARDKSLMREALAAAGVRQPDYRVTGADGDVAEIAAELGTPGVVKTITLSASRGDISEDTPADSDQ